jgi:hypothetical protein
MPKVEVEFVLLVAVSSEPWAGLAGGDIILYHTEVEADEMGKFRRREEKNTKAEGYIKRPWILKSPFCAPNRQVSFFAMADCHRRLERML